ncbi:alpha/beta hydrolase [Micromonospora sp. WMMD754]|uniref:alpha/beta hydrolase n=1 Tax=Micromonospora sp. WMMD754 TaxID=3404114 RepID=UPI003BF4E7EF
MRECTAAPTSVASWPVAKVPKRAGQVCLFRNITDPVTPAEWADQWQENIPDATVLTYHHNGHASLSTAVSLTKTSGCRALAAVKANQG